MPFYGWSELERSVKDRLPLVVHPTLLVSATEDRIVDPRHAAEAVKLLPRGQHLSIAKCGHAPQMEKPWTVNRVVTHFLTSPRPTPRPRWTEMLLATPNTIL